MHFYLLNLYNTLWPAAEADNDPKCLGSGWHNGKMTYYIFLK